MKTVKKTPWDRDYEPEYYDKYEVIKRFIEKERYLSAKDISEIIGIKVQNIHLRVKKYKKLSVLTFEEVDLYDLRNNLKPEVIDTTCVQDLKLDNEVQQFVDCLDSEKVSNTRMTHFKNDNLDIEKVSNTRMTHFKKGTIHYIELPRKGANKPTIYYSPNFLDWFQLDTAQTFTLEQRSKGYAAMLLKYSVMTETIKELQSGIKSYQNSRAELDTQNSIYAKKLSAENKDLKTSNEELQRKFDILKGLFKQMYTDLDRFVEKRDNVHKENFINAVEKEIKEKLEKKDELFK